MKSTVAFLLVLLSSCASVVSPSKDQASVAAHATQATKASTRTPSSSDELTPFSPARTFTGDKARRFYEVSALEEEGVNQSEFWGSCVYLQKGSAKRVLFVDTSEGSISDDKLRTELCELSWKNYEGIESPDYDDEDGWNGMVGPIHYQCEKIEEPKLPVSYDCEIMKLKE